MSRTHRPEGSPYAPNREAETAAMLDALGIESVEELFDIPEAVRFDDSFDIQARSEQEVIREVEGLFEENDDIVSFLGRGSHSHYIPALVDHIAGRSEFLTSYTQYQPEASQGFLQALFEYQSIIVELTGLEVANCSLYDAATALGEAATFSDRLRQTSGDRILVPEQLHPGRRSTLENYCLGPGLTVESYPMDDGTADIEALEAAIDEETVMVYAESPTVRGTLEPELAAIGELASDGDAAFCLGTDPVALSILERPADVGADVVIGDAGVLGLPDSFGMGLGLFATREEYVRQVPGRLVGASDDQEDNRAFALTLVTREQHIRRERATSNICTNQAWAALRSAMHAAYLGPEGLVDLAKQCVERPKEVAERMDDIGGVTAPMHDRHHFREFTWDCGEDASRVADVLINRGFAVHALEDDVLQLRVTDQPQPAVDRFIEELTEVLA